MSSVHKSSYEEMERVLGEWLCHRHAEALRVLDVGSASVANQALTYRALMPAAWAYTGADMGRGRNVDIVMASQYALPGADWDVVISGQTLEHVRNPFRLVAEMARVLKPGGLLLVTAPWQWEIHRYPLDCFRILPDGMAALFEDARLQTMRTWTNKFDCWGVAMKPGPPAQLATEANENAEGKG